MNPTGSPGRWTHSSWGWQIAAAECEGRGWGSARWAPEWGGGGGGGELITRRQFCSVTVSQQGEWLSHLTVLRVDCSLGHVQDGAQGLDVVALPVPDWLCQDLQLQILLLAHVLALRLEETVLKQCFREDTPSLPQAQTLVDLTARFLKAFMQACRSARSGCWSWGDTMNKRAKVSLMKHNVLLCLTNVVKGFGADLHVSVQLLEQRRVALQPGEGFTQAGGESQDAWRRRPLRLHVPTQLFAGKDQQRFIGNKSPESRLSRIFILR